MLVSNPKWLSRVSGNRAPLGRLFCFPYAGGSSSIFRGWQNCLGSSVEVCPVHLPGRGIRLSEAPITDLRRMIVALAQGLEPYLVPPYAFFGHSMGALLAYELTLYLRETRRQPPYLLGVSARQAPDIAVEVQPASRVSDEEFIALLGGLSTETVTLLADLSLRKIHLPILRADFQLCESVRPRMEPPLQMPIAAFAGMQDTTVSCDMIDRWRVHTHDRFVINALSGDHFFLNKCGAEVCRLLGDELRMAYGGKLQNCSSAG